MNNIKGILIDPYLQEICEVFVPVDDEGSTLAGMYEAIQCDTVDVSRGCLAFLPSHSQDDIWFDDNGMICGDNPKYAFVLPGCVPLVGRGLILGWNDNGDSVSHSLTEEDIVELRSVIQWGTVRIE